jgi:hypothetical protein
MPGWYVMLARRAATGGGRSGAGGSWPGGQASPTGPSTASTDRSQGHLPDGAAAPHSRPLGGRARSRGARSGHDAQLHQEAEHVRPPQCSACRPPCIRKKSTPLVVICFPVAGCRQTRPGGCRCRSPGRPPARPRRSRPGPRPAYPGRPAGPCRRTAWPARGSGCRRYGRPHRGSAAPPGRLGSGR